METKSYSIDIAGDTLTAEFSPLVEQANGSVIIRHGDTVVLATAVMSKNPREGLGFFPLTVDYEERFYAAGRILGSRFVRREARPSEEAILLGRIVDRSIRPLFDHRIRQDVHVVITTLSIDDKHDPDVLAVIGASLALGTSNIPWAGPISAVRVGKKDGELSVNPVYETRNTSEFETIFCGKNGKINMIEAEGKEITEADAIRAFETGLKEIERLNTFQQDIINEIGKTKITFVFPVPAKELEDKFKQDYWPRLEEALYEHDKAAWKEKINSLKKEWLTFVETEFNETPRALGDDMFEEAINDIIHKNIVEPASGKEKRPDGRSLTELRPLWAQARFLDRSHGSALFFRGQTHILSVVTLGAPGDVLIVEGMEVREKRNFMHHYNFPHFSVGETGPMRGPGRRDIGHGALAGKALKAVIPEQKEFPYTIRVVSETLSSNGSSSMGSVCASTLALMDAGVPIKSPVAGIAMGLMTGKDKNGNQAYKVLTDIQGPEDHHGDMDFKAAGTKNGLTAIQMDVKVEGVSIEMLEKALLQAKDARLQIMDVLLKELASPRPELSPFAPRIITMQINPDKIREVIGPGGKVINEIIDLTGAQIDIEQDGTIFITGMDEAAAKKAQNLVEEIVREYEPGQRFTGKVTRIFNFGAMVEIAPRTEGLVHISELAPFRVEKVTDIVDTGDEVPVEIISIDDMGRINLSIKKIATLEPKRGRPPEGNRPNNSHSPRNS